MLASLWRLVSIYLSVHKKKYSYITVKMYNDVAALENRSSKD